MKKKSEKNLFGKMKNDLGERKRFFWNESLGIQIFNQSKRDRYGNFGIEADLELIWV